MKPIFDKLTSLFLPLADLNRTSKTEGGRVGEDTRLEDGSHGRLLLARCCIDLWHSRDTFR